MLVKGTPATGILIQLTHWAQDKMAGIANDILKYIPLTQQVLILK